MIVETQSVAFPVLGHGKTICLGDTIILDATTSSALDYVWQGGTSQPICLAAKPGIYHVTIETHCAVLTDTILLIPPNKEEIIIPNVFTPNHDGFNEYVEIRGATYEVELAIFNRYGKEVFRYYNYANNWNGGNLSPGTYFYSITIGCTNEGFKGWVDMLRE